MVFEQFLESDKIKKHILNIFLLGIFYVIVGAIVSFIFFKDAISVAMLFTTTLLLVPSMYIILNIEEKIESRQGIKHFFHNHKDIFKVALFLFLGVFIAFLVLGFLKLPVFDYQLGFLEARGDLTGEVISEFAAEEYSPDMSKVVALISQNLFVVVIAFILSLFYGAGAFFLIVLNASVFAAFIVTVIDKIGNALSMVGLFLIHLVPEIAGFLVAAIAGGVISRAIIREKFGSAGFKNVMMDALMLLLISAGLIIIAAFLEVFVSGRFVKAIL